MPLTGSYQGCRVLCGSQENHAAKKVGVTISVRRKLTEQSRIVVGVGRPLASIARAENARRSVQGRNDQPAVVCDTGQSCSGGYGSGFDQRVLNKGSTIFYRAGNVGFGLVNKIEADTRQHRAHFVNFALVASGEEQIHYSDQYSFCVSFNVVLAPLEVGVPATCASTLIR